MRHLRIGLRATAAASLSVASVLCAGLSPVVGAPLDAPACEQLQSRLDHLRSEGAAADMARGPDWARANLSPDRLQRIGALLEVEEQLNFRCGLAKARITLPTIVEGGEEEIPGPGEASVDGTPKTVVLPQKAPSGAKRPAAAAAAGGTPIPAPKAAAPGTPVTKPAVAKPAPKKTAAPQKPSVKPAAEVTEPKKAPPARKKQQPKADDAYRPPRPPQTGGDGGAALAPRQ